MHAVEPFLMFCGEQHGRCEDAMERYCSVFPDSRVVSVDRYGPDDPMGPEGTVRVAVFEIAGHRVRAIDSAAAHAFTFTPAISLWIECGSAGEVDALGAQLVEGGHYLMPPDDYGFAPRFCWVADRWGVTWQLHLAP